MMMEAVQIRRVVAMLAAAVLLQVTAAGCGLFGARAGQAVPAASPGAGTTATAPTPATVASATYGAGETLGALMVAHAITPAVVAMPAAAAPVKLAAVQFLTTHIGWAVGSRCTTASVCQGLILSTRDGGATWPAPVVLPAALTGLQFLDTQNGWAFGPSALYATKDGGATWTSVPLPADAGRVAAVQASFADAADGWLILHLQACATQGCGVRLYATSDGGATWRLLASNEPPGGGSTGLGWSEFVAGGDIGGGHGWMLAQTPAGIMQTTADSGRTWQGQALSSGGSPVGGGFAANGTGWVAASRGTGAPTVRVWESADSGTAWRSITTVSGRVAGLFAAMDGATAWLMLQPASATACPAYPCGASVSVVSAMGTATAPAPLAGWTLLNISALDATTAWAVAAGTGGYALLATTDGGKTWRPLYQAAKAATLGRLWGFVDSGHGWALGSATDPTAMLKTADGGATWTPAGRVPVTQPLAAGFSDLLHGWVADLQGAYVTADGGATWTKITVPAAAIAAMGFTTPKDGWLLPEATKSQPAVALQVTHDSGATWTSTGTGPFFNVAFASPTQGWATARGADGHVHLVASTDGGASWTPVADLGPFQWDPSGPAPLWVGAQLAAAAPDDVWLASGQHLLQSIDGGHTWIDLQGPTATRLAAAAGGLLWVGAGPAVYDVTAAGRTWTQVAWEGAQ